MKRSVLAVALSVALPACGLLPRVGPDYRQPPLAVPDGWQATAPNALAHGGSLDAMTDWWRQMDDPLLLALIEAAQRESATLAQARARIERARYEAVSAGVAGLPTADVGLAAQRAAVSFGGPVMHQTTRQASLMANWEIDLFGGIARQQEAAEAGLAASQARWHDARVSVAAETASAYLQIRFLERRIAQTEADSASRSATARLTETLAKAGFQASAQAALSTASEADAASALTEIRAQRDLQIKALVALTGMAEPALRQGLAAGTGTFPRPVGFAVQAMPASVLMQRPDIAAAERDVASASASIGQAEAARYPRLTLSGNITPLRLTADGTTLSARTWSIGPSLSMPLFDGGRIAANVDAARAQYVAADAAYRQKARDAVREVEQAMVRLNAAAGREADVHRAADDYRIAFSAAEARYKAGFAGLVELEDARRTMLAADINLAAWQQEQVAAWVALYRAVGGGWQTGQSEQAHAGNAQQPQAGKAQ